MKYVLFRNDYPVELRRKNISGKVMLAMIATTSGTVEEIHPIYSPHHKLSLAAIEAAKFLEVEPGICSGKPTAMPMKFSLSYILN